MLEFAYNFISAGQQLHWPMPACTSPTLLSLVRELLTYLAYNIMCETLIFTASNWMFPNSAVIIKNQQYAGYSCFIPSMYVWFFQKINSHATAIKRCSHTHVIPVNVTMTNASKIIKACRAQPNFFPKILAWRINVYILDNLQTLHLYQITSSKHRIYHTSISCLLCNAVSHH